MLLNSCPAVVHSEAVQTAEAWMAVGTMVPGSSSQVWGIHTFCSFTILDKLCHSEGLLPHIAEAPCDCQN